MRTKLLMPLLALFAATADGDTGGGATPPAPEERPNAIDGAELTIDGVTFTFKATADPANLFDVQIGATAEETDAALAAAIQRAAEALPVAAISTPAEQEESAPPAFADQFPDIGEWFARVQKWAQFNSRPIPELTPDYQAAFAAEELPSDAAARRCQQKTDFANANGNGLTPGNR